MRYNLLILNRPSKDEAILEPEYLKNCPGYHWMQAVTKLSWKRGKMIDWKPLGARLIIVGMLICHAGSGIADDKTVTTPAQNNKIIEILKKPPVL